MFILSSSISWTKQLSRKLCSFKDEGNGRGEEKKKKRKEKKKKKKNKNKRT